MTDDRQRIEAELLGQLRDRLQMADELAVDTPLLTDGLLDSLLIMDMVTYVETTYGVSVEPAEIAPRHLRNVTAMADMVIAKLNSGKASA